VKTWLLTIVGSCHSTALKQQRRRALVPLPEDDTQDGYALIATTPDPESASIRRDEEHTLEKLVARLPDKHREVLILRELEDMRYREIAAVTNLPMGTAMSRLARARSVLKEHWLLQADGEPHAVP
jgi:RNA polymerase sigma-70 factor, ECF subfamily